MNPKKTPLSIRIIYWLTNVILGLAFIICAAAIAINVLIFSNLIGNEMQLHTELPAKVDFLEMGHLHLQGTNIQVELVEASTKIHFFNTPSFLAKKFGLVVLFACAMLLYITWTFRKFILNVKNGIIFEIGNIGLLKHLAYSFALLWLFMVIYNRAVYYYIAKNLEFENLRISSEITSNSWLLLLALFIWVLSHIFITGVKLQDEQKLTI